MGMNERNQRAMTNESESAIPITTTPNADRMGNTNG